MTTVEAKPETEQEEIATERCEAAAVAIKELALANVSFLESGERMANSTLYDSLEDLIETCARFPQVSWPQKSWEFLESIVSIAGAVDEDKNNWRSNSPQHHRRLSFHLQRAADQLPNLLDHSPPENIIVDIETIGELVEQKLSDDQIAKIYGWYTPAGKPDRKRVRLAKKGKEKTPETVTHPPAISGPHRQPFLGDLDSCLSLFLQD